MCTLDRTHIISEKNNANGNNHQTSFARKNKRLEKINENELSISAYTTTNYNDIPTTTTGAGIMRGFPNGCNCSAVRYA